MHLFAFAHEKSSTGSTPVLDFSDRLSTLIIAFPFLYHSICHESIGDRIADDGSNDPGSTCLPDEEEFPNGLRYICNYRLLQPILRLSTHGWGWAFQS